MSKIRKISLIIKNWVLKGKRALDEGLKPHSNGDIFSWFKEVFFEIKKFKRKRRREIEKRRMIRRIIFIIYINLFKFFNWKLNVIFILYK